MTDTNKRAAPAKAAPSNRAQSLAAARTQNAKFQRIAQLSTIVDWFVDAADHAPTRDLEMRLRDLAAGTADLICAERRTALCGRGAR
jgi:hypothetical protein